MIELLFASLETLTSTLTSTVMMLGQNPSVVDNIKDELKMHGLLDHNQELTYSRIQRLEYTQRVCKEVLYRCPPAGGVFRRVERTFEMQVFFRKDNKI